MADEVANPPARRAGLVPQMVTRGARPTPTPERALNSFNGEKGQSSPGTGVRAARCVFDKASIAGRAGRCRTGDV
jgi:hypothetical protein